MPLSHSTVLFVGGEKAEALSKLRFGQESGLSGDTASREKMDDANQELESSLEPIYD